MAELPTKPDVEEAAGAIAGKAVRTRVLSSLALDERVGAHVVFKAECEQVTGSFKYRGALTHMTELLKLDPSVKKVVAASSGNFGTALAHVGREFGVEVTVFMPKPGIAFKEAAVQEHGGEVRHYTRGANERDRLCNEFAARPGRRAFRRRTTAG